MANKQKTARRGDPPSADEATRPSWEERVRAVSFPRRARPPAIKGTRTSITGEGITVRHGAAYERPADDLLLDDE